MNKLILVVVGLIFASMLFLAGFSTDSVANTLEVTDIEISGTEIDPLVAERLNKALAPVNAQIPILQVRLSAMPGVYEVILANEQVLYINNEGSHFIAGDLFGLVDGNVSNLSGDAKGLARTAFNKIRKEEMDKVDPSTYIIYPATVEKVATVVIFTDVDCPYCRKLHAEMAEYNALGIEIRYAAYPRAGVGSNAYVNMVSAWCAEDRNVAIDSLKRLKSIEARTCDNPVDLHLSVGDAIGVTGTPAIVMEDGTILPGYLPPAQLAMQMGLI